MFDIQAIRERHEKAEKDWVAPDRTGWRFMVGGQAHTDRATLLSALSAAEARADAAEARVGELEAALKPFAELAEIKLCGTWRDDESIQRTDLAYHVKFSHLRNAARALKRDTE